MPRVIRFFPGLFFLAVQLLSAQPAVKLAAGDRIAAEIEAEATHRYLVDLKDGQFVSGAVDQQTVDVVVAVYDPSDVLIGTFDESAWGPEDVVFETSRAGDYRIEVSGFKQATGRYVVRYPQVGPIAATPEEQVDRLMASYGEETPGGVVAVVEGGRLRFAKGYGMADLEFGAPNTPATPFHMASVSKQFTGFAIVLLAQQGKLSLDDDVRTYLPDLHDFGVPITLRQLLNHTSGLRDQWNLWTLGGGRMDDVIRQEDLYRLIVRQRELNFRPGDEHLYCNTGFMLLTRVAEAVTGEAFGDWMRTNVFDPLGMASTQIYDDHERIVHGRAYSYHYANGGLKKSVLSYANAGATSLFTTAEDLARWIRNFHTGEVGGLQAFATMQERGVLNSGDTLDYALGIVVDRYKGLRRLQHGGADAGYRTMLTYFPDLDAGVIVLGNLASFRAGSLADQVADAFFADRFTADGPPAPTSPSAVALPPERLARYAGTYMNAAGGTVIVGQDGDRLTAGIDGAFPIALAARSASDFDAVGREGRIVFQIAPDGGVTGLTVRRQGATDYHRQRPWEPAADDLQAFAGRYYSPELETFYTVGVSDGKLMAQHIRHGEFPLTVREQDVFSSTLWFFGVAAFERDSAGVVTGMRVSNGRVRHLLFEKID
ncbi:MAG: serine hydrolase [Rhodothermales bacterium]